MSDDVPAGFYHAEGDPPDTVRYWNGDHWAGGPIPPPASVGPGPDHTRFGSTGRRVAASLIDIVVSTTLFGALMMLLWMPVFDETGVDRYDGATETPRSVELPGEFFLGVIAIQAASVIVPTLMIALLGGTPGKLLVGLRVTKPDGQTTPPGLGPAILRCLPWLSFMVPFLGPLAWIGVQIANIIMTSDDPERRSLHDRVGGTRVVHRYLLGP